MPEILILYYSRNGSTAQLARQVARGVEATPGGSARVRTVPAVSADTAQTAPSVPDDGPPYVVQQDLAECDGLILGSPTRFGNMAAALKYFIDGTSGEWLSGTLAAKPGAVFTSTNSMHGGQESTLLSMMLPLLHHGMLIVGVPYTVPELNATQSGGTPYGASHVSGLADSAMPTADEAAIAQALGRRVADVAARLVS